MTPARPAVRPAGPADNEALLELISRSPQGGRLLLGSDRAPDFFARAAPYDESRVLVVEDGSGIAGTVSCGLKWVLVGGERQRAAYIFDLAVAPRSRGQGWARALLAETEAWAKEKGAHFLYAHVMGGNRAGLGSFAAAQYRQVALLKTRLFPLWASGRSLDHRVRVVEEGDWPALGRLVHEEYERYDLFRADSRDSLRDLWEGMPGYRADRVWVVGGPPAAVLGLWDYSSISRAVVLRLPPELRATQAVARLIRGVGLPFPRVPALGQPLRYGLLLGAAGDPSALKGLFRYCLVRARDEGLDAIVWFYDPRTAVPWARGLSFGSSYHLVAKALQPGPAATLGERPLWVDPIDL